MCSNHDDGVTAAIIQCETCQSLCADCDRFLHLSRKTRNHRRTVCKEEEDAIRVELHEGCGRTKLFWLLALADSRTLKAIIEFRDGNIAAISGPTMSTGKNLLFGIFFEILFWLFFVFILLEQEDAAFVGQLVIRAYWQWEMCALTKNVRNLQ